MRFVSHTAKKTSATLYCFRSGIEKPSVAQTDKRPRSVGKTRTGLFCPAHIRVNRKSNGEIKIRYQTTHGPHDLSIGRLTMTTEERQTIAAQLKDRVPSEFIIDKIREEATELTPYTMVSTKDVNNIRQGLNLFEGKLDANDFRSTQLWVDKLGNDGSNPILFYETGVAEADGEKSPPFMLVFARPIQLQLLATHARDGNVNMDATHNTSGYGYQLASILVADAFGNGVATAFCLSGGSSQNEWAKFLSVVQAELQRVHGETFRLQVKVLMTDMDNSFYLGWVAALGDVQHIYCGFHVKKSWETNIVKVSLMILAMVCNNMNFVI